VKSEAQFAQKDRMYENFTASDAMMVPTIYKNDVEMLDDDMYDIQVQDLKSQTTSY
jgi:hypothetical protein